MFVIISHVANHNSSAILSVIIISTISGTSVFSPLKNQLSSRYEYVGINKLFDSPCIAFSGNTDIGLVQIVNTAVNIIQATKKFANTHQANINIFLRKLAIIKLSFDRNSSLMDGSSHFNLLNHPSGIAFSVYSVHFLSVRSLQILGGIPIPNSKTFTPDFLAIMKCHNSCNRTSVININTQIIIDRIIIVYL
jgi:hypothetical protein